jgi:hypothetical protein
MTRRRTAWLATLCLLLSSVVLAQPEREQSTDPFVFIETALRQIGARETECPANIKQATRGREMGALCARFDGDFESFRSQWRERVSRVEPKTGWSVNGQTYDRVYVVGTQAVGIRFSMGDILVVFK